MPTENLPSITAMAPSQITATFSRPKMRALGRALGDAHVLHLHAGVDLVHHQVLVGRPPLVLAQVELDGHHPAQRLDEVRAALRLVGELLVGRVALRVVEDPARRHVEERGADHHGGQREAVPPHHDEGQHHHQAVHHRLDEGRRERALHRVHAAELGDDVADVALLEPRERQLHQVREEGGEQPQVQVGATGTRSPRPARPSPPR